jgi:hypothetical protein
MMLPYTFVLMNWAAVASVYRFARCGPDAHKSVWTKHARHTACEHAAE